MVLALLTGAFGFLTVAFAVDLWGRPAPLPDIPPVDPEFLETRTWRESYADLVAADEDVSYFDCYLCHDEEKKIELKFDDAGNIILPEEHEDIVMGHGTHGRNNDCFHCHDQDKLTHLQARDGEPLPMDQSTQLCGSCHGPTMRDWIFGSHGRTSGYWDRRKGEVTKLDCVNCHDPHSPQFPSREPAPGPHYLRQTGHATGVPHQPSQDGDQGDGESGTPEQAPDDDDGEHRDESNES